jgi:hypothetical protein
MRLFLWLVGVPGLLLELRRRNGIVSLCIRPWNDWIDLRIVHATSVPGHQEAAYVNTLFKDEYIADKYVRHLDRQG